MLLTVFGMLSGNGNKRQKHNNTRATLNGALAVILFL